MTAATWVCCQLGAREHYAVPRALHRHGRLAALVTDAWAPPGGAIRRLTALRAARLGQRYHPELSSAPVRDFTVSLVTHELLWRARRQSGWDLFAARNRWFERRAAAVIDLVANPRRDGAILFAHSYAALDIFRRARGLGWRLVLGQIDPGPEHFKIVARAGQQASEFGAPPSAPPASYFDHWLEECRLADRVVVNSEWSRSCLEQSGIPPGKLVVVPLAYEATASTEPPPVGRRYPDAFSAERPLRVLFVGHVAVSKGAAALLESLALLHDVPMELSLVGEVVMRVPSQYRSHPAVRWVGAVSRSDVMRRYQQADLLIFPSLSDGFGMAQVEAQAWRLPIIASTSCGRVVEDGVNGLLLDEESPEAIAGAIRRLAADPQLLARFSRNSGSHGETSITELGAALLRLEPS